MADNKDSTAVSPEHLFHRKLVCIGYPGIVNNEENMLKTLGGIQNISKVSQHILMLVFIFILNIFFIRYLIVSEYVSFSEVTTLLL